MLRDGLGGPICLTDCFLVRAFFLTDGGSNVILSGFIDYTLFPVLVVLNLTSLACILSLTPEAMSLNRMSFTF